MLHLYLGAHSVFLCYPSLVLNIFLTFHPICPYEVEQIPPCTSLVIVVGYVWLGHRYLLNELDLLERKRIVGLILQGHLLSEN